MAASEKLSGSFGDSVVLIVRPSHEGRGSGFEPSIEMKPTGSERFSCDFLRRVRAANPRLLSIVSVCVVLWARAAAGQAPTVTIDAASQVTGVSAIIGGTVNANGLATWAQFRWGTTTSYDHNGFPFQWPATEVTLTFSNLLTGLSTNTTYHYQLVATNSGGQTLSPDMTFTTSADVPLPVVSINPATDVTDSSATLTGTVDPKGYGVEVFVGLSTGLSSTSEFVETLPAQSGPLPVSVTLSNLMPNTTYDCQLSAANAINLDASSTNITFTTLFAPTAITGSATDITANSATISGDLNPNGFNTTYYFQWGTSTSYGNTTAPSTVPAQNTPINGIAAGLTGLSVGTTYHYQFVATNSSGTYFGGDMSFTTASTITIQGQTFTYSTNNGAVTITAYAGPGGAVPIPSAIAGFPVTAIADSVFFGQGNLTSVTLPDTLTSLGASVFGLCSGLTSITLPISLTSLGSGCFGGCSGLASASLPAGLTDLPDSVFSGCSGLITITIPNSVTNIGGEAFADCGSLTNVIIGNSVLNISSGAFGNCTNLTAVAIPASAVSIDMSTFQNGENGAFAGCTSLREINVDPLNSVYSSTDGVLFSKDQSELFIYPQANPRTYYAMPDGVVVIEDSAFLNCSNLTGIAFGNQVANIANWAFLGCSGLTRITIPDSVTNIENAAYGKGVAGGVFYGCSSLTNVVVGKGLSYLGIGAFSECTNLLSVYFRGDAPTPGTLMPGPVYVFGYDDPTTVYYLPGTTGWGSSYAGQPAVLWNPQIQTGDASFGVRLNRFGFSIAGTADIPIVIEACTNAGVGSWVLLQSCSLTNGSVYFGDPQWRNYSSRVYRVRSP
jgi:hypothetical protein